MGINPMSLIEAIRSGQNPQQLVMGVLQDKMGDTPLGQNLMGMAQNNQVDQIEQFARNYVAQRGGDFDKEFSAFKQHLGIR